MKTKSLRPPLLSSNTSFDIAFPFEKPGLFRVEASEVVSMDELDREKRDPNPQYYYVPTPFGYPSHYDINPSFDRNVQRPYIHPNPFNPYVVAPQQVLPADQRLFFNVFVGTTITTVSTSTSTSRPACSSSSSFTQC